VTNARLGIAGLVVIVAASALLLQPFGYNQGSHFALVKALAHGTPTIDRYRDYTGDESYFHGHFYSNKAPGLAFFSLPAYEVLGALHLPRGVHVLSLWGALLPALLLLLLVRAMAERVEPGLGAAAAATLGVATLVLPFTGLFFAHLLSALLGFAAFALLWRERDGRAQLWLVGAAGLLAGLAVTTEYPLAIVGGVLELYALTRAPRLRRGAAYAAGALVGLVPLAAYNWWAFGSITHLSYSDVTAQRGTAGQRAAAVQHPEVFGLSLPSPHVATELLLSWRGLLVFTPVLATAGGGIWLLYRAGRRAEALTIGGVCVALVVFNASFWGPFGGWGPGPRYLISMLPFVAVPIAVAWRRLPITTGALGAVSAAMVLLATVEMPILFLHGDTAKIGTLLHGLAHGDVTKTVLGHAWLAVLPFVLVLASGLVLVGKATNALPVRRRDVEGALVAVLGWIVVTLSTPTLLDGVPQHRALGAVAAILLAGLVIWAVARVLRGGLAAAIPALPLLALAAPSVHRHAEWAVFVLAAALAATAFAERSSRSWTAAGTTES
jgi:hypothetical protein